MELQVRTRIVEGVVLVEVAGELEIYTAPQLQEQLEAQLNQGTKTLIVSLAQVEFIDSTGLAVLNAARVRLRDQGGKLVLVCNKERVIRPFEISGLHRLFVLFPTIEAAVATVKEGKEVTDGPSS